MERFTWTRAFLAWTLVSLSPCGALSAQERADGPDSVNVTIVLSKHDGETLVSRLPYALVVIAAEEAAPPAQLRMGIEVPITIDGDGTQQYRNVGTNIDCRARALGEGRFRLDIAIEQSSVYPQDEASNGNPLFRTFHSKHDAILRDGQSAELTSATDAVSGEVSKVVVTLAVLSAP